jgi:hypothetical protein
MRSKEGRYVEIREAAADVVLCIRQAIPSSGVELCLTAGATCNAGKGANRKALGFLACWQQAGSWGLFHR